MLAINRFRVGDPAAFLGRAEPVVQFLAQCPGNVSAELVRNIDDPQLWCLLSRWRDVGSYRRSFNGLQAKLLLMPLLAEAVDEPGAYDTDALVGENRPRGG